ncbi:MAG: helix-hairpin-helix domain-containing protein [Candidatus Limnocylindria bacterium]
MSQPDRIALAAGGGALLLALVAAWLFVVPPEPDAVALTEVSGAPFATTGVDVDAPTTAPTTIVVDVEGAVVTPGVRELPAGSRIADAIAAAGGYASDADLDAAATAINLAQPIVDGEQVRIPRVGEDTAGSVAGGSDPVVGGSTSGSTALVNLNTATPEQLEALPGIGPVTVQKIVAARQEQPFASLDDAVQRGVINRGQLEDIQALATAG